MNPTARTCFLFGALVLLVFGIACLKQRLTREPAPPAFLPGGSTGFGDSRHAQPSDQPTILSAEPGHEHPADSGPGSYVNERNMQQEVRPLPLEGLSPRPQEVPINVVQPDALVPESPVGSATQRSRYEPPSAVPVDDAARVLPAPDDSNDPPAGPVVLASFDSPAAPISQTVTTVDNDSLWTISERAYGRGDYYKALFLLNRGSVASPDRLGAGIELQVPPVSELRQQFPEACPLVADHSAKPRGR